MPQGWALSPKLFGEMQLLSVTVLYLTLQSWTREHLPELEGLPTAESWQSSFHTALSSLPAEAGISRGKRGPSPQLASSLLIHSPLSRPLWPLAAGTSGSSQAAINYSGGPAQQHALLLRIREAHWLLLPSSLSHSASCWAVVKAQGLNAGAKCQQRKATHDLLRVS